MAGVGRKLIRVELDLRNNFSLGYFAYKVIY